MLSYEGRFIMPLRGLENDLYFMIAAIIFQEDIRDRLIISVNPDGRRLMDGSAFCPDLILSSAPSIVDGELIPCIRCGRFNPKLIALAPYAKKR